MASIWDRVPSEIYDEIFSHLAKPQFESEHSTRPETDFSWYIHTFDYIQHAGRTGPWFHWFTLTPTSGDMQLRLVCRAFDRAMTRAFFKYENAILRPWDSKNLDFIRTTILNEGNDFVSNFSRLHILLAPPGDPSVSIFEQAPTSIFGHAPLVFDQPWLETQYDEAKLLNQSLRAFIPLFEDVLARVPRLQSLIITIPERWNARDPWHEYWSEFDIISNVESDEEFDEETARDGEMMQLEFLELIRSKIAGIFASPRVSLSLLTDLRLTLPCTYDFKVISAKISDTTALQLRHLYLEYIDATGPGGDLYYTRCWEGDEGWDGDEGHLFSNLQNQYPNTKYMHDVCLLVNRCRNLESLGLVCTQPICLASLDWQPHSGGLKNLYIERAITTPDKLLSLISQDKIKAIRIVDISLRSGTWQSVLEHLCASSSLVYAHLYNLIYDKHGDSYDRAEYNNRPWENIDVLWSSVDEELEKIRDLVRAVQSRGGKVAKSLVSKADDIDELDELDENGGMAWAQPMD